MFPALLAATTPLAKASAAPVTLTPQQLQQMLQSQTLTYQHQSPLQMHAPWLTHTLAGLFIVAAIALIGLLAVQTTKQEGLSGTIGGRVDSAYRGRLGFDGQIARVTQAVAIAFVVIATLVSLTGI
ncbi:MAG TPA: preprotein translocase subunit SecG [Candidatus Lustribacter sp.]|nr:preprotein translocase subunit SecG [Candidatus Lustribacter sp.]